MEADGVGEMCHEAIKDCPIDCRKALYSTVLTSGGTSMFPGYSTRLENELEKLWLQANKKSKKINFKIAIKDPPRRKYSVFQGAGIYARHLNENEGTWISKDEWEEMGKNCLKRLSANQ